MSSLNEKIIRLEEDLARSRMHGTESTEPLSIAQEKTLLVPREDQDRTNTVEKGQKVVHIESVPVPLGTGEANPSPSTAKVVHIESAPVPLGTGEANPSPSTAKVVHIESAPVPLGAGDDESRELPRPRKGSFAFGINAIKWSEPSEPEFSPHKPAKAKAKGVATRVPSKLSSERLGITSTGSDGVAER